MFWVILEPSGKDYAIPWFSAVKGMKYILSILIFKNEFLL